MTAHDVPAPRLPELDPHELRARAETEAESGDYAAATARSLLAIAGELALIRKLMQKRK
jgi:hypothetical protein